MQQDAFRALKILHFAITACFTGFAIIIFILVKTGKLHAANPSLERIFQLVAVFLSVVIFLIGFNLFKRKIMAARNSPGNGEARFQLYRSACIVWWVMLEGPGMFAVIGFVLTGNYAFLALAIVHVLALLTFMPRKDNIAVLLNLSSQEVAQLEGK